MPLTDLFTFILKENTPGSVVAEVTIFPDHPLFKGHFPGQPITPGVCLIEILRQVLSDVTGKQLMLVSAKDIKFIASVIPPDTSNINLTIHYSQNEEGIVTNCIFGDEKLTYSKLRGVFREE